MNLTGIFVAPQAVCSDECLMYGLFRVNDFENCLETLSQLTVIVFCDSIFGYTELNLTEVDDPVGTVYQHIYLCSIVFVIDSEYPGKHLRTHS